VAKIGKRPSILALQLGRNSDNLHANRCKMSGNLRLMVSGETNALPRDLYKLYILWGRNVWDCPRWALPVIWQASAIMGDGSMEGRVNLDLRVGNRAAGSPARLQRMVSLRNGPAEQKKHSLRSMCQPLREIMKDMRRRALGLRRAWQHLPGAGLALD
jgi:hypothetical protein